MKQLAWLMICLAFSTSVALAQKSDELWSVNEGTLVGIGSSSLKDTYLSPGGTGMVYKGFGLRVLNERMKMTKLADYNISRQQIFNVDIAYTDNPASTANEFAGFVDYSLGYHYHFSPIEGLKLLAGGSFHAMGGFIYNTRNGNNPASAKVDIDLNLSGMAIYNFNIKNYPLTVRYQMEIPFSGVMFAPHYGQSYYEIFSLGNNSGVVQYNSFHNKFAMKNYLTVDFPIWDFTFKAGYLGSFYYTDVNNVQCRIVSNSFVLGVAKEFISFGGRKLKQNKGQYQSAFY